MSDITYKCKACGAVIELEERFCRKCGAENVLRIEKIAKLKSKRKKVDKKQDKNFIRASKWRKSMQRDSASEMRDRYLTSKARNLRMQETKLKTGSTYEGKLRWIKEQRYDLKRPIQEIADDLGESMIAVGKYIDEIENQKNE